jgi:uncharacterized membrane protein YfcA
MLVLSIVFLSVLVSTMTGFGAALLAMPLLSAIIGIRQAAALVVTVSLLQGLVMIWKYRSSFQPLEMRRLLTGGFLGIPVGVFVLSTVEERLVLTFLGILVIGYVLYMFMSRPHPSIDPKWALIFGFLGGGLSGAYNSYGPPIVVYGNLRGWESEPFKYNVQLFGVLNSPVVIAAHLWQGHYTELVWHYVLWSLPLIIVALLCGFYLESFIKRDLFQKMVYGLMLIMGVMMIDFG